MTDTRFLKALRLLPDGHSIVLENFAGKTNKPNKDGLMRASIVRGSRRIMQHVSSGERLIEWIEFAVEGLSGAD